MIYYDAKDKAVHESDSLICLYFAVVEKAKISGSLKSLEQILLSLLVLILMHFGKAGAQQIPSSSSSLHHDHDHHYHQTRV